MHGQGPGDRGGVHLGTSAVDQTKEPGSTCSIFTHASAYLAPHSLPASCVPPKVLATLSLGGKGEDSARTGTSRIAARLQEAARQREGGADPLHCTHGRSTGTHRPRWRPAVRCSFQAAGTAGPSRQASPRPGKKQTAGARLFGFGGEWYAVLGRPGAHLKWCTTCEAGRGRPNATGATGPLARAKPEPPNASPTGEINTHHSHKGFMLHHECWRGAQRNPCMGSDASNTTSASHLR